MATKKPIILNSNTLDLKGKYSQELDTLRSIFETWTDNDLISVLEEAQGDLELAIGRISEGQAKQWEVKPKRKERKKVETPVRGAFRGGRGGRARGRGGRGGSFN